MSSNENLGRWAALAVLLLTGCSREPAERAALPSAEPAAPLRTRDATALLGSVSSPEQRANAVKSVEPGNPGVAVVELFTSEGCSSCPPADRLLARLTGQAKTGALPVYTLSFHVDYWNYLGWRDRFSSSSYSERQHGYSGISANGGTYTPQAVVNGEAECVGSDASRVGDLIDAALKQPSRTRIALEARRAGQGIAIDYRVSGAIAGRVLNLALVEPRAESQVEHGENAGERLVHVNVVRSFTSRALSEGADGHWVFASVGDFATHRVGVVAYAEGTTQRDISGAAAVELP